MRYQKGNGPHEIEKALKILQEYEAAKSQYEISEGERQRIQARGTGWTEQKDKIANDVRKKKQILDNIEKKLAKAESDAGLSRSELLVEKLKKNNPTPATPFEAMDVDTEKDMAEYRYESLNAKEEILRRQRQSKGGRKKQRGGLELQPKIKPTYNRTSLAQDKRIELKLEEVEIILRIFKPINVDMSLIRKITAFFVSNDVAEMMYRSGLGPGHARFPDETEFNPEAIPLIEEYKRISRMLIINMGVDILELLEIFPREAMELEEWNSMSQIEQHKVVIHSYLSGLKDLVNEQLLDQDLDFFEAIEEQRRSLNFDRNSLDTTQRSTLNQQAKRDLTLALKSMHGEDEVIELYLKFILKIPTLEILNNRGFGPKGQYHPDEPRFNPGASNLLNEYIRVQKIIIDTIKITLDKTAESARKIIPQSQWNDLELEEKARLVIFMSLNKIKTLVNKDADEDFDVNLYDDL